MMRVDGHLQAIVDSMDLEEKVGQLLMIRPVEEQVRRLHPGSVIVKDEDVGDNIESARRLVADLQRVNAETSSTPLWIHGFIYRRPWAGPRDGEIAERYSVTEAEDLCFQLGRTWREAGLHNYPSPTVNVPTFETCIMHRWAISDDPEVTVDYTRAITRGLIRARCGTMAQHFPAHGATPVDSHQDVPVIDLDFDALMRVHIPPYVASFEQGCTTICTAHLKCPALDPDENNIATTSRAILTDFLRGRLGFRGLIISDGIRMAGFTRQGDQGATSVRAVVAGCDCICIPDTDDLAEHVFQALLEASLEGRLPLERLQEAALQNLAFKDWLGIL